MHCEITRRSSREYLLGPVAMARRQAVVTSLHTAAHSLCEDARSSLQFSIHTVIATGEPPNRKDGALAHANMHGRRARSTYSMTY
ncbi:hypothetical protein K466DRAFT_366803 [Polyporus arcularius HHB13444]|uniref:Uncharacterized protein n=1 Tax=Polyporus arcularius HHB13444 TaxID=1314778 RepID=A0A5C3PN73_9APHY|nr:hypothetical protein K466DRAFT_366803 [Polyporus arcularius HHB13444]